MKNQRKQFSLKQKLHTAYKEQKIKGNGRTEMLVPLLMLEVCQDLKSSVSLFQSTVKGGKRFSQDKPPKQAQMAKRKMVNSGLHRGERFWISTPDNTSLWEKHGHNNRKVPDLVKQIWLTYVDKNSHPGKLWGRKNLLTHMPSQAGAMAHMPLDTWDCTEVICPEEHSEDPTTERTTRKKARGDTAGTHMMVILTCLFLSLSHSFSLSPPSPPFPFLSLLFPPPPPHPFAVK